MRIESEIARSKIYTWRERESLGIRDAENSYDNHLSLLCLSFNPACFALSPLRRVTFRSARYAMVLQNAHKGLLGQSQTKPPNDHSATTTNLKSRRDTMNQSRKSSAQTQTIYAWDGFRNGAVPNPDQPTLTTPLAPATTPRQTHCGTRNHGRHHFLNSSSCGFCLLFYCITLRLLFGSVQRYHRFFLLQIYRMSISYPQLHFYSFPSYHVYYYIPQTILSKYWSQCNRRIHSS